MQSPCPVENHVSPNVVIFIFSVKLEEQEFLCGLRKFSHLYGKIFIIILLYYSNWIIWKMQLNFKVYSWPWLKHSQHKVQLCFWSFQPYLVAFLCRWSLFSCHGDCSYRVFEGLTWLIAFEIKKKTKKHVSWSLCWQFKGYKLNLH